MYERRNAADTQRYQYSSHGSNTAGFSDLASAAIRERAGRLSLEVDDDEVLAGPQDLTEVIVAVDADVHGRHLRMQHPLEPPEDVPMEVGDLDRLRDVLHPSADQPEDLPRERPKGLVERSLRERRDRFGSEGRIVTVARERDVQLGGALPEEMGGFEERSDRLLGKLR
jgi:hypothetical protein